MFKLVNKIIGFSTKNLYLAELGQRYDGVDSKYRPTEKFVGFNPKVQILCKKKIKNQKPIYKDIFISSSYRYFGDNNAMYGEVVAFHFKPVVALTKRISYKDAEEILDKVNIESIKKATIKKLKQKN